MEVILGKRSSRMDKDEAGKNSMSRELTVPTLLASALRQPNGTATFSYCHTSVLLLIYGVKCLPSPQLNSFLRFSFLFYFI